MTTIGFAGLANSHPFTDAQHLRALRPTARLVAWDPSATRRKLFAAEQPVAQLVGSLEELLKASPHVVLVTRPPREVAGIVGRALEAGAAVWITKPAATSQAELEALRRVIVGSEERVCTSSVLRFAPELDDLPSPIRRAHVVANHHIDYWLDPAQCWQDEAGGLVPMMGVHAFELLERLLGPTIRVTSCEARRLREIGLTSPDVASGAVWADGAEGTFVIDGTTEGQAYAVEVEGADGAVVRRVLGQGGGDDPLGIRRAAKALLALADERPAPLAWEHSQAVLRCIVEARAWIEGKPR